MVRVGEAEIVLDAIDNVSKTLDRIEKKVKGTSDTIDKESSKSKKSFDKLGSVAQIALGVTLAGAVEQAADVFRRFVVQGVKDAILFERQFKALEIQTGRTADVLINDIQSASDSLISRFDAMIAANKALILGIDQDLIPALTETAVALGKITGRTPSQAIEDISTGIGRQSRLILDNLGIILSLETAYDSYAETIGKTASELTDLEKKQALTTEVIKRSEAVVLAMNSTTETTADSIDRLKTELRDLTESFVPLIEGSKRYFSVQYRLTQEIKATNDEYQITRDRIDLLSDAIIRQTKNMSGLQQEASSARDAINAIFEDPSEKQLDLEFDIDKLELTRLKLEKIKDTLSGTQRREEATSLLEGVGVGSEAELNDRLDRLRNALELERKELEVNREKIRREEREDGVLDSRASVRSSEDIQSIYDKRVKTLDEIKIKIQEKETLIDNIKNRLQEQLEIESRITDEIQKQVELKRELEVTAI